MGSIHDFNAAQVEHRNLEAAQLLERISLGGRSVLDMAKRIPGDSSVRRSIDALGALMADAADQAAILCDEKARLEVQYLRRYCQVLRQHADSQDLLEIEALGVAIERFADGLAREVARAP